MANLYTTAEYKGRPDDAEQKRLLEQAEQEHDWECLKPYPLLLAIWQGKHNNDVMQIARWVSHFRMPFIRPDYQRITVQLQHKGTTPSIEQYAMGSATLGHRLCKPNCGECDYITGERIAEPMPF